LILYFLNEKKQEQEKEPSSIIDTSLTSKKQLENSIAIFKELILRRKRKILNLVFVATETGIMKRDYENMLPFERDVFEKLVKAFEDGDKELSKTLSGNKNKENKNRMIMFSQDSEQFVDMSGNPLGPYTSGELVNLPSEVAEILVSSGKATFVDEE
jgi:DNA replication initiation complex subunit (GINS family)